MKRTKLSKTINRHFYLIVDTETTQRGTVADFGAVLITKQGEIVERFGAMVFESLRFASFVRGCYRSRFCAMV